MKKIQKSGKCSAAVAEPPTIAELLESCYVVHVHDRRDLAFVLDATGDEILAAVETARRGRRLPLLPYSPAQGWRVNAAENDADRFWESCQIARRLADWLTRCRDSGVDLTIGPLDLQRWWDDGTSRLTAVDVLRWLG